MREIDSMVGDCGLSQFVGRVVSRDLVAAGKEARPPTSDDVHVGWKLRDGEMMMAQLACQEVDVSGRRRTFEVEHSSHSKHALGPFSDRHHLIL
jgi:hypothetical protein